MSIVETRAQFSQAYEELGRIVPNTLTVIESETCWIEEILFCGIGTSDVTITVQDNQGSPIPLYKDETLTQSGTTKSTLGITAKRIRMTNGFSVQASAANACTMRVRYWK